ncbi:hypothetical protein CU098_001686, partial [Rhizopus stolonifer]
MSTPVKYEYLISKSGDLLFSVTVGTLAYFLNERDNPRAQNGKTLLELVSRARQRKIQQRETNRKLDDQVHLGQAYPEITTVSTGGPVYTTDILTATKGFNFYQITKVVRQFLNKAYGTDIQFYQQLDKKPDYFICDAFNDPCIDTAVQFKVPFAITCTGMLYQDINVPYINGLGTTHHATSEHMTLWERFQHKYVDLIKTLWYIYPELKELDQYRQAYGMTSLGLNRFKQWDNGLKLINTYFGFFPPQIMSPLTHMIGPVITARQRTLSEQEAVFLNTHKRVAYVAFGQIIKPSKHEIELLFSGLLDQMEHQRLDGILWVGLKKQIQTLEAEDPLLVWQFNTTQSGHVIQPPLLSHALFQRHVFMPPWTSQFSVLQHSATVLFVSHGGAESANEATFNGVPILVHPYVGDQRLVGRALTLAGVARTHERADCTFELLRQHINELLVDEDGSVGRNLTRMKTLAQIGSKRKTFAADLV